MPLTELLLLERFGDADPFLLRILFERTDADPPVARAVPDVRRPGRSRT